MAGILATTERNTDVRDRESLIRKNTAFPIRLAGGPTYPFLAGLELLPLLAALAANGFCDENLAVRMGMAVVLAPVLNRPLSHLPGQFMFLTPLSSEVPREEHPFTISSSPSAKTTSPPPLRLRGISLPAYAACNRAPRCSSTVPMGISWGETSGHGPGYIRSLRSCVNERLG